MSEINSPRPIIKVAVALIFNATQQLLIAQRASHVPHAGLWEFPGGKIEAHETPQEGLLREVKEEVDLDVLQSHFFTKIDHDYTDKSVSLFVYQVTEFKGIAICKESQQDLRWVRIDELGNFLFPAANEKIICSLNVITQHKAKQSLSLS